jgi:hypothetical protein
MCGYSIMASMPIWMGDVYERGDWDKKMVAVMLFLIWQMFAAPFLSVCK